VSETLCRRSAATPQFAQPTPPFARPTPQFADQRAICRPNALFADQRAVCRPTPKAFANSSPALELATTLGPMNRLLCNAESVGNAACQRFQR
jgi:hypothetical protein